MGFLAAYDSKIDFFECNPHFTIPEEFGCLPGKLGKKKASKVMWAIAFLVDPSEENLFRHIPEEEKKLLLINDVIEDEEFNWNEYSKAVDLFTTMTLSQAERSLKTWNEIMAQRDSALKSFFKEALETKDVKLIKDLDAILSKTSKFYEDYKNVKKNFEEDINKKGTGQKIKSLSDSGEI